MRSTCKTTILALLATVLAAPLPSAAQNVQGQSLTGNWVRTDSNNDPNDRMRIRVDPNGAILTFVPSTASGAWKVGQVLWRAIQPNGSLEVRGSDGNYYASTVTFKGPDVIDIDVQHTGAGYDQTWQRGGPTIDGDWEQIAPAGGPSDGTQVRAQGAGASIRFMPASAPRGFRIGRQLWQNIGAGGAMQALGSDGRYHPAQVTLIGMDTLRVDSNSPQVASGQIWVRPGIVAAARAGLSGPPANPNQPGSGLRPPGGLPTAPAPPATPPALPASSGACIATSLPHDQTGRRWGWGLISGTDDDAREETIGIREHMIADFRGSAGNAPVEVERSRLPGFVDGFAFLWQPMSRRIQWEEHRDLTAAEYDQRSQDARSAGLRAFDIEAYETSSGVRYAGIWIRNTEGLAWRADHDLTAQAYGQAFQNLRDNGYRLIDMEAYPTPAGVRYAAIWYMSCDNANWRQVRDMGRASYQSRVDSLATLGFRVIDFESYRTPGGQRYAAIWEKIPAGRAWAVRTDRDLNWFLNYHRQYVDEGLRLIDYESYETANGLRYAGVWAENDRRHDFALKAAVDDSIQDYRSDHGIPGISVVVMQDDEVIYRRGFGWADSVRQKAAHSGTVYLTASVAKVVGANIAARLEQRGVLDLSDSTSVYLDSLPSHHTHTVEQLFAKIACVQHYGGPEPDTTRVYAFRMPALTQIWNAPLLSNCTPGTRYHYSTHGFTYAGAVLEEVTGDPIADIISDEITRPFGLFSMRPVTSGRHGGFGGLGVRPYHLARGYAWTAANGSQPANYENTTWKVLGGGLQTDALDLARFGQLTRENTIADTTRLWTPLATNATTPRWDTTNTNAIPTVGLAWVLGRANGRRMAQHGGVSMARFGGARAHLRVYRDDGLVIAILTNQRETTLTSAALNLNAGDAHPIWRLSTAIAGAVFANPPPP